MNLPRLLVAAACTVASLNSWSSIMATPTSEAVARVKADCGFDLQAPFTAPSTRANVAETRGGAFRAQFEVKPNKWTTAATVSVVFNCRAPGNEGSKTVASNVEQSGSGSANTPPRGSARAIVEAEDAGGRYARHVAVERAITAKNWQGSVVYIDGLFGDGQHSKMSMLLACDNAMLRSCVEVYVEPSITLRGQNLEVLMDMIRGIAQVPY